MLRRFRRQNQESGALHTAVREEKSKISSDNQGASVDAPIPLEETTNITTCEQQPYYRTREGHTKQLASNKYDGTTKSTGTSTSKRSFWRSRILSSPTTKRTEKTGKGTASTRRKSGTSKTESTAQGIKSNKSSKKDHAHEHENQVDEGNENRIEVESLGKHGKMGSKSCHHHESDRLARPKYSSATQDTSTNVVCVGGGGGISSKSYDGAGAISGTTEGQGLGQTKHQRLVHHNHETSWQANLSGPVLSRHSSTSSHPTPQSSVKVASRRSFSSPSGAGNIINAEIYPSVGTNRQRYSTSSSTTYQSGGKVRKGPSRFSLRRLFYGNPILAQPAILQSPLPLPSVANEIPNASKTVNSGIVQIMSQIA